MATNYTRGANLERKVMRRLRDEGYVAMRSAGSHGPWDVIAYNERCVLFIQVKSSRWPSGAGRARIEEAARKLPEQAIAEVWRWRPRKTNPDIAAWVDDKWIAY